MELKTIIAELKKNHVNSSDERTNDFKNLCKKLNLSYREEQESLFYAALDQMEKYKIVVAKAPCGIGKSILLVLLAMYLYQRDEKVVLCVPSTPLLWQIEPLLASELHKWNDEPKAGKYLSTMKFEELCKHDPKSFNDCFLLIDEAHDFPPNQ